MGDVFPFPQRTGDIDAAVAWYQQRCQALKDPMLPKVADRLIWAPTEQQLVDMVFRTTGERFDFTGHPMLQNDWTFMVDPNLGRR